MFYREDGVDVNGSRSVCLMGCELSECPQAPEKNADLLRFSRLKLERNLRFSALLQAPLPNRSSQIFRHLQAAGNNDKNHQACPENKLCCAVLGRTDRHWRSMPLRPTLLPNFYFYKRR